MHGQPRPGSRARRIHAEDLARGVDQWSTGVAGFDPGIDLDETGEALGVPTVAVTGGDRLAEGSDRAPGCARGPTGPAGVPDADNRLADGGGIAAGRDSPQTAGVDQLDDGHVTGAVIADHLGRVGLAAADVR